MQSNSLGILGGANHTSEDEIKMPPLYLPQHDASDAETDTT